MGTILISFKVYRCIDFIDALNQFTSNLKISKFFFVDSYAQMSQYQVDALLQLQFSKTNFFYNIARRSEIW